MSASLVVKRAKTIQPQGRALSGSDADLQNENVRWKLFMILEVFQQRPEVGDGIGYSFRMIGVRLSAGQSLFISLARRRLP